MLFTPTVFLQICAAAEGHVELGLLEEASTMLEELPPEFKRGRRAMMLSIAILMKKEKFLEASYLAEELALNEPGNVKHLLLVARCRFLAGKAVDALWWLQAHAAQCSQSPDYHYFRAQCHQAVGDPEAAGAELRTAHELEERPRWGAPTPAKPKPQEKANEPEAVNVFFGPQKTTETH